jgi:hypothetical protein
MPVNGNLPASTNVNSTTEYFNNYFTDRFTTSPNVNDAVIGYFQSVTGDEDSGKALAATVIYTALSQGLEPMSLVDEFRKLKAGRRIEVKTPIPTDSVIDTYTSYDQIVADKNEYPVGQLFYVSANNVFFRSYYEQIPVDQPLVIQTSYGNPTFNSNNIELQREAILSGIPILEDIAMPIEPMYFANDAPISANVSAVTREAYYDADTIGDLEFAVPSGLENPDDAIIKTYLDQAIQIQSVVGYKRETVSLGGGQYEYNYFFVSFTKEEDEITPFLTVLLNQNRVNTSLLGISNTPPVNKYVQRTILA